MYSRGQTIPRFPRDGLREQYCSSLTDPEDLATVGKFPVTGHLQYRLSHRRQFYHFND